MLFRLCHGIFERRRLRSTAATKTCLGVAAAVFFVDVHKNRTAIKGTQRHPNFAENLVAQ